MEKNKGVKNMKIETIKTDTFTMNYFRFGHGKEALVIIPGVSVQRVMDSAELIAESYKLLTDDFTIYVFERRNDMPSVYTVHDMAGDTIEAARALGLDSVSLFGASQGGMIAMEMAIEAPELVQRMIVGSTAARVTNQQYALFEDLIRLARGRDTEGLYMAFGKAVYPRETFERSRGELLAAAKLVSNEDLDRFITMSEGMKGFDIVNDLGRIACPVMVTGSLDDGVFGPEPSRQIAEHIKGRTDCELVMYDGYGHDAYDFAPDYRERMLRFLKS